MNPKILVVDDEAYIAIMVASRLKAHGYHVVTALSGEDGLAKVRSEKPGLILLDIMMPEMDGYECLERLKSDPETQNIPVLMLSAMAQKADIEKALEGGAKDYVVKPFAPEELVNKVKENLPPGE